MKTQAYTILAFDPHLSLMANSAPAPVVSPLPLHLCSTPLDSEYITK